jgi:thiol-disulfide isomerase/thioredoxin
MTDEQFAWAPPAGAKDASKMAAEQQGQDATALVGKPAPAFKIKSLEGKDVALADYKGKVVLLDFWATWCGPCRMSLPHIQEIYESHKKDGLIGYAVDLAEEKPLVEKFVTTAKMTIPVLLDTEGKTGEAYSADAIPETVLIGKDGKIKNVWIGVTEPSVITKAVEEALHG